MNVHRVRGFPVVVRLSTLRQPALYLQTRPRPRCFNRQEGEGLILGVEKKEQGIYSA